MITKKTPPVINDISQLNRVIQDIYRDLNEIIDALGKALTSPPLQTEGREGDVRVSQSGTNYIVSIRAKDGWVASASGTFTFQEKL